MAIEKQITYDHQITEDGTILTRRITRIVEDGEELAKSYHRFTTLPGMTKEQSGIDVEDLRSDTLISTIHTSEVINKYKEKENKT